MPSLLGLQPPTILQSVLDEADVALIVIDNESKFVFTNQSALRMFGMTERMNGMSLVDWRRGYKFHDAEGREIPAEQAPIVRALSGEKIAPQDVRVTLPDGSVKWLHGSGHHFSVLGLSGIFVIFTDETEEVELRRAADKVQRLEAAGVLASSLAHDFNNMLSVIDANIALALSEPEVPAEARASLQVAAHAARKGAALANRLARFSHPHETRTSDVLVNEVVHASLELIRPLLGSRVSLKLDLREGLPIIQGDPDEIERALINLMLNALDAMPHAGELKVSTGLEFGAPGEGGRSNQFVSISIADTGMGIPEQLQARIFDPFFTTKHEGRGSGLGLSSTYRIVQEHEGRIEVESSPHHGTKFTVSFPVKNAD